MTLSEELLWRGFVKQTTFSDLSTLDKKKITFYHGFDASADSQSVGNLAAMMLDRLFLKHGHKAIILAGGATSLIGDPGGKDAERQLQAETVIRRNVTNAEKEIKRIFKGYQYKLVNNLDWTKDLKILDFLRDIGKHFSMTPLIQRDYIAKRLGQDGGGISYAEFSYTILQGMDYLHLFEKFGCSLQLGGSDQWGNCLSGVDLIRKLHGKEVHVITLPLIINKQTGRKFGKSEAGAVWLNSAKTSPYQFYQFWLNLDDEGVEDYLKIFTELSKDQIESTIQKFAHDRSSRIAQKTLAKEVTNLVHGEEETKKQIRIAEALSKQSLETLNDNEISLLKKEMPTAKVSRDGSIIEALLKSGLASSSSAAKQLLKDSAVYINGAKATKQSFTKDDFKNNKLFLRRGKALKDTALIELNN